MKKPWTHYVVVGPFTAGFISAIGLLGLWMDYLGKEEFLRRSAENWTSNYITIPCALFLILWGHLSFFHYKYRKQKKNRAVI